MIRPGERVAAGNRGRLGGAIQYRAALLADEVLVGSPELARLGLIALALVLQAIVLSAPGHFRPAGSWYFATLVSIGTFVSLALCFLAALPRPHLPVRARQALAAAALAALVILSTIGLLRGVSGLHQMTQGTPYSNDGAVMDLYAAHQLLQGHNPYRKANLVTALAAIDAPSTTTTPLMRGQFSGARAYPSEAAIQQVFINVLRYEPRTIPPEFESKYNYPSGSFLFILPFVWAGLRDMRFLYAVAILAMGAYIWRRMPRALQPLVPLLLLSSVPLVVLEAGGQPDPLYAFFLMVGYAEWATPWLSPTFMGLAAGTKQLAWFFIPFYLLFVLREYGWREALRRLAIMLGIFLAMNAPFILQSPHAYVSSIAGPMSDPMFPLGIGIIALFVSNVLPLLPKAAFTVAEVGASLGSIGAFARFRLLTPACGVALAALPLFFAWRSLVNYFYLVPLLTVAVLAAEARQRAVRQAETKIDALPTLATSR